jgi:dTMP kinase
MNRGLFFSLDGLDGAGKSTQCRLLVDWLRASGHEVTECHDPGGTEIGKVLRGLLLEHRGEMTMACEAMLFMASRAQLMAEIINPALRAGRVVVCDRFLLANVVYQGHAGGLDSKMLYDIALFATDGLEPALTLVLDLPVEAALARRRGPADRVEGRDRDYHARVREGFQAEAHRRPDRIRLIDANLPPAMVHEQIRQAVLAHIEHEYE